MRMHTMIGARWQRRTTGWLMTLWMMAMAGLPALAQTPPDRCTDPDASLSQGNDLYCLTLTPKPELIGATGHVEMGRVPSPFGIAVAPDGRHRHTLTFTLDGLPDPATLGPYTTYVAWAMPPVLDPVVKLGEVSNGRHRLGEVAFNKFIEIGRAHV